MRSLSSPFQKELPNIQMIPLPVGLEAHKMPLGELKMSLNEAADPAIDLCLTCVVGKWKRQVLWWKRIMHEPKKAI